MLSANSKSYLPLPSSEIRTLFTENWSQFYLLLPNIKFVCVLVCVCLCMYYYFHPSLKCLQSAYLILPKLPPTCLFYEVPCALSLKIISGLDKMWNEAKRPRSSQKWSQMDIILWQMGRRVFTSLPCLWWGNWRSILLIEPHPSSLTLSWLARLGLYPQSSLHYFCHLIIPFYSKIFVFLSSNNILSLLLVSILGYF